ncbi:DUF4352 domain-containing protein [Conexibacter woesei]|uniref:DUF4352 domain-containing protein n=1 Tax=Conexibacter woesei TaxID=191495 RepID=UPI00042708D6|nr:DUF4352 domain-containing protein [Conexibacter woesei]
MKMVLWAGTALACCGLAACGGSGRTVTVVKTTTIAAAASTTPATATAPSTTATTTATRTTTASGKPPVCSQKVTDTLQGTCVKGDVRLTVTGRAHPLVLKTLKVRYKRLRVAAGTASSDGVHATATGAFVIVSVAVTNRTNSPQEFRGAGDETATLVVDNRQYTQDTHAATEADDASFMFQMKTIQPDEAQTGDLVFDVPEARVAAIKDHGVILFADFGRGADENPPLGAIRLYN